MSTAAFSDTGIDRPAPEGLSVLDPFVQAGIVGSYEVELARTIHRLDDRLEDSVILALALAARAPRFGHVCVRLDDLTIQLAELEGDEPIDLPWPPLEAWVEAVRTSPLVADPATASIEPLRPLVWDGGRLYLQRYWHYEVAVADDLAERADGGRGGRSDPETAPTLSGVLDIVFGPDDSSRPDLQRRAVEVSMGPGVSIIAGGPGSGKTYATARLLAVAHLLASSLPSGSWPQVALAAPTGKAAARMGEAVTVAAESLAAEGVVEPELARRLASIVPTTVHSLLGWKDRTHFRHGRSDPLPHDLVVIDETSMLSLPLTAKLLDAVRPDARLVLVGDPFQLASIEAGTVMSDLVGPDPQLSAGRPLSGRVTVLSDMRRFAEESGIAALAAAVRDGDADAALSLLAGGARDVTWVDPGDVPGVDAVVDQVVAAGADVVTAALRGDASGALAAARSVKVLAATRHGHLGVDDWTARIESTLAARIDGYLPRRRWHIGRPVMVTGNDRTNGVFNGDTGVVVHTGATAVVAMPSGLEIRHLAPSRLDRVETWWAMTVHKSQGSEFPTAVVSLPEWRSPILTRELLYTAVTRAEGRLTLIATEEAVRDAIGQPMARASGLQERLWPD